MKKASEINPNDYTKVFNNKEYVEIEVDESLSVTSIDLKKCIFNLQLGKILNLNNCNVDDCKFIGISGKSLNINQHEGIIKNSTFNLAPTGHLIVAAINLDNCTFIGESGSKLFISSSNTRKLQNKNYTPSKILKTKGQFANLSIDESEIHLYEDTSHTRGFRSSNSTFIDFDIQGATKELNLTRCVFTSSKSKKSKWNKKIKLNAYCQETTIEYTEINPFYLVAKCADKSTLDISNATLVDKWSYLRKEYSGVKLFIILLFTFAFFLPILTRSFILLLMSNVNNIIIILDKAPLWEVLLFGGYSGYYAVLHCILTISLITYNIGRFTLTLNIAKLREEGSFLTDSGFNQSVHFDKYSTFLKWDSILKIFYLISIAYSLFKLYETSMLLVPVF
jgi:hypothetical protein